MIDALIPVIKGIWHQDMTVLMALSSGVFVYMIIATFIGLESAFLPAAPLPCDSIVVLAGSLSAIGVVNGSLMFTLLVVVATLGSWLAFYQGRMLNNHPTGTKWVSKIPIEKRRIVDNLIARNELLAMFLARFMPVVRTLLAMVVGAFKVDKTASLSFLFVSMCSAAMWVSVLMGCGYMISLLPDEIAHLITMGLLVMPIMSLLIAGLTGLVYFVRLPRLPVTESNEKI